MICRSHRSNFSKYCTYDTTTTTLNGKSRLGGLSLNSVSTRGFILSLVEAVGLPKEEVKDEQLEAVIDVVMDLIPPGLLPKKEIKWNLKQREAMPVFQDEAAQLDFENFGNAIMPALTELLYIKGGDRSEKYLASDNLNVYVRVPSTLMTDAGEGRVDFNILKGSGTVGEVKRISPKIFQQDTIDYTFRLEEALAATNLPAWPDLGEPTVFRRCASIFTRRIRWTLYRP